jgi:hypothetical protein
MSAQGCGLRIPAYSLISRVHARVRKKMRPKPLIRNPQPFCEVLPFWRDLLDRVTSQLSAEVER